MHGIVSLTFISVAKTSENQRTNARAQYWTKTLNLFGTEHPDTQVV